MKTGLLTASLLAGFFILPAQAQDSPGALADAFCATVVAEDAEALAALYTEDADSYGPDGANAKGRAAIAESWGPFFATFDNFTCTLDEAGLMKAGKSAAAWGLWTMTATPAEGGDTVIMTGRYSDVSVKTKEGWRYRADHASMNAPVKEEVAAEAAPAEE